MVLVQKMFDKSYHPYGDEFRQRGDPIGYYKAMIKNVFGKRPKDLNYALKEFNDFTIRKGQTIREEYIRWTAVMETVDDINTSNITEGQKLALLTRIFDNDNRPFVVRAITHAALEGWTYA